MKKIILSSIILLFLITSCKTETPPEIFEAVITFIMNKVEKSDGTVWKNARLLDEIDASIVVRTGKKSRAEMNVNNRYRLMLSDDTVFVPAQLTKKEIRFELKKGSIFARIKKLFENEKLTIMTPSLAIGVRGTDFIVSITGNKVRAAVREGEINVRLNLKSLKKALNHAHPKIQAIARKLSAGIQVSGFESVEFSTETISQIDAFIEKAFTSSDIDKQLNTISKLSEIIKTNALTSDFTEGLLYFSAVPETEFKKGKPITLDGGTEHTEIFINGEKAGSGLFAKIFSPGSYQFKFKLNQFEHNVTKVVKDSDNLPEILKAPFTAGMINRRPVQRQGSGPYDANPEDRAAN